MNAFEKVRKLSFRGPGNFPKATKLAFPAECGKAIFYKDKPIDSYLL